MGTLKQIFKFYFSLEDREQTNSYRERKAELIRTLDDKLGPVTGLQWRKHYTGEYKDLAGYRAIIRDVAQANVRASEVARSLNESLAYGEDIFKASVNPRSADFDIGNINIYLRREDVNHLNFDNIFEFQENTTIALPLPPEA